MTFTLTEVVQLCSAILTVAGVITLMVSLWKKAKAPEKMLLQRVEKLEKKVDKHDEYIERDNRRFGELEEGNRIIQRAMLALLKHAKGDGDTSSITEAEKDLESYLISK